MSLSRRSLLLGAVSPLVLGAAEAVAEAPPSAGASPSKKVLRYAFEVAETTLDPAKLSDLYSRTLTPHIFEGLYTYDYLARPVKFKPLTADGMPQVSDDFRTWTIKVRPGIYFADDPAFKGKKRELVAQDYVYAFKRFADPANLSPAWNGMETDDYLGLKELREEALKNKKPFDYDREIEGVRALDRYTVRFVVKHPRPRLIETFAGGDLYGAVAREVVEFYGEKFEEHPIGTGPFKLVEWRRSSFLAFERNPDYREVLFEAEPAADDAEGQAILAKFKGRRLPMIDRVEISIIEEEQPRWLSFINNEADFAYRVGYQFVPQAMPNGKVAPNLAKLGIRGYHIVEPASSYYIFNMDDPTVGGYGPANVALRRAIGLGIDAKLQINYAYSGLGAVAQSAILPQTGSRELRTHSEFGEHDPARAQALLDLYGYKDRNGDGYREMPDGSPLVLRIATQADLRSRRISEAMDRNMRAIGIRVESVVAQWPENLKAARAGKLQMWTLSISAAGPDPAPIYQMYDSHEIGGENYARFKMPAVDEMYRKLQLLPDGPERLAVFAEIEKLCLAYMPYKFVLERLSLDMAQPQLVGYRRPVFWQDWWHHVDIDNSLRKPR
jgi:ABC-type transport system substrate-binding protein